MGVDLSSFAQVLTRELGPLAEGDQLMKLGLLLAVAFLILAGILVGGQPHVGDIDTLWCRFDLRVSRQPADQCHIVYQFPITSAYLNWSVGA